MSLKTFPFYSQEDVNDCAPACLRMIASFYGQELSIPQIREAVSPRGKGVTLLDLARGGEALGFRCYAIEAALSDLKEDLPLPCIAHLPLGHYVVVFDRSAGHCTVGDPARGVSEMPWAEFERQWRVSSQGNGASPSPKGILLLLERTGLEAIADSSGKVSTLDFVWRYARVHRGAIVQVSLGLGITGLLQITLPFLTQVLVDSGIGNRDIGLIAIVLLAQLMLLVGRNLTSLFRGWLVMNVGTSASAALIVDLLVKLFRLPVTYFETHTVGDTLRRMEDSNRVRYFLTGACLDLLYAASTLVVLAIVLGWYSWILLGVFLLGTAVHLSYIFLFLRPRRELDKRSFRAMAAAETALVELLVGMQTLKLAGAENRKRAQWERLFAQLTKVSLDRSRIDLFQQVGGSFIAEARNLLVTAVAAVLVVQGQLTLGMLLAAQFAVGALSTPFAQIVGFISSLQDASLSVGRLWEVHQLKEEQASGPIGAMVPPGAQPLVLEAVRFSYPSARGAEVLKGISCTIPAGETTAIVGASGSGKTSLLKILLRLYQQDEGIIRVGASRLQEIKPALWRASCGAVLQQDQVFADTVANNIALAEEHPDRGRLWEVIRVAQLERVVESLPDGLDTILGPQGIGLSEGQRQRLLIARALYRDPPYLFFDEATSALDTTTEQALLTSLRSAFSGRTAIVVAHRLSTVRTARQILVMDRGLIVESGTHEQLLASRGAYFGLVRNQVELAGSQA